MRGFIYIFCLLLAFPLWAEESDSKQLVVAFAQDNMANDFRKAQVFEVRDEISKHAGFSFVFSDAHGKTSLLIHQINEFINDKVDALIVGTNDEKAVVPVVTKAHEAGIPVIILDRGIQSTNYTTFINSDNVKIGNMGAEYIAKKLNGKGVALLFEGLLEADVTQLRSKGFLDVMNKHKGIKVIKATGNYLRKDALLAMEKLLDEGVHIDAIFSESDSMLSGVRVALEYRKIKPESILMVGCDYTSEAKAAILEGSQTASVLFPLGGTESAQVAVEILNGKKVSKTITLPTKLVTKANARETPPIF